ncbi:MAG: hypothetical protein IKR39_05420 [Lachnospiraceae bacterium]|nr:hypothetical protein [Lachnospiraceae bacterium]
MDKRNSGTYKKQHIDSLNIFLWVCGILTVIKSVFTEYGYDASYHIALSWRHINGDRLFKEMWEPHQTSAFILDFLMWLYRLFVPSMEGVALFLQICGAVIFVGVALIAYRILSPKVGTRMATIISVIFMAVRPKGMTLLEFSNELMLFSFLLIISLTELIIDKKNVYCVISAVLTAIIALVYPTAILVFIPIFFLLLKTDKKQAVRYLLICVGCGICAFLYIGISVGYRQFTDTILDIMSGDSTHGSESIWSKFRINGIDIPYAFNFLLPLIIIVGTILRKRMSNVEEAIWKTGVCISISTFIGVIVLTNVGILPTFGYLVLGAAVSLIPISKISPKHGSVITLVLCISLLCVRGLYVMNGYSEMNGRFIANIENIIRVGPTKGIVAPLTVADEARESIEDYKNGIKNNDSVLVVADWIADSIVYLYTDAEIANYSTIDTTTYSEKLEEYWNQYPHKRPTVIAYKSYRGNMVPSDNNFIGKLISNQYESDYVGEQWTFYRKKDAN